jgi:hypothetical protein
MTKIAICNQSRKYYMKYKTENGCTRTSEYIRDRIRCHGEVSVPVVYLITYNRTDDIVTASSHCSSVFVQNEVSPG